MHASAAHKQLGCSAFSTPSNWWQSKSTPFLQLWCPLTHWFLPYMMILIIPPPKVSSADGLGFRPLTSCKTFKSQDSWRMFKKLWSLIWVYMFDRYWSSCGSYWSLDWAVFLGHFFFLKHCINWFVWEVSTSFVGAYWQFGLVPYT